MLLTALLPKLTATKMKRISLSIPEDLYNFLLEEGKRNKETVQQSILRSVKFHANSRCYFIPDADEDIDYECMYDGDFIEI